MEDSTIVDLYLHRNEQAITETKRKYGSRLHRLSASIVGNDEDAEECENDTYLTTWNLIPPHEPADYLFSFLAKITRNLSINCCTKKKAKKRQAVLVELTTEMEQCIPAPSNSPCSMTDSEFGTIVSSFLRTQKKETRHVFLRRYWFGDSISEIATKFSLSESKVKSMLFRTRNKLRLYFIKEGYEL